MAPVKSQILIVKLAAIGDVVMALPLLKALKVRFPQSHITWMVGTQAAPLLKAIAGIDTIIEVDEKSLLIGSVWRKIRAVLSAWQKVFGKKFDLVLTLHSDPRYQILCWPVFCKDKRAWGRNLKRGLPIAGRYHAQECLQLLDGALGEIERKLEYPPIKLPSGPLVLDSRPVVVLAPGGAKNTLADDSLRRWPVSFYAALAKKLTPVARVVVVGGPSDFWVVPYFEAIPHENWVGRLDLLQLVALFKQSSLFITHDSGPLHLAKLVGVSTLALFGPTNPYEKVSTEENIEVIWGGKHLACRPCYNGKTYASCARNGCLQSLSPEQVFAKAVLKLGLRRDREVKLNALTN